MNTKHVTSLEISKQLAEAGIVIDSKFWWHFKIDELGNRCYGKLVHFPSNTSANDYPAPIATELLERLPASIQLAHPQSNSLTTYNAHYWKVPAGAYAEYVSAEMKTKYKHCGAYAEAQNLPDALALLLIRLTKDGLI